MKKLIALVFILAALVVGFIPLVTARMAAKAFSRPNDLYAQDSLKEAIIWKMRLQLFTDARRVAEKAIIWFPESKHLDSFIYCAARCAERDKVYDASMHWYSRFLELFPDHPWSKQVRAELENVKEKSGAKKG